jgi:tetratricopeptide (TPR) repeat protein
MALVRTSLLLALILLSAELFSQDKSIVDLFKSNSRKADRLFEHKEYSGAKKYYLKVFKRDSLNPLYKLRLAECNMFLNNTEESELWYRQVINNSAIIDPKHELNYAEVLLSNGKLEDAKVWFEKYNKDNQKDKRSKTMAVSVSSIKKLLKDSLAYTVRPVNFNSSDADFSTVFYNDGIVFLSSRKYLSVIRNVNATDNTLFPNLYYTELINDSSFTKPVKFHEDLHSTLHDGPITFFDQSRKVIFSRNQKALENNGTKKLGLYCAELNKKGKKWKKIYELPFSNKNYNVSHPYFHDPTNTLYFVSDMEGGFGGSDIYRVFYIGGQWSKPVNMGALINTEKNETFPFVSADTVLYFSSNGHRGLGGLDIFRTDLNRISPVLNPGYPVNSSKDDFAFVLNEPGNEGFFSSNRKNGGLDDDIYTVSLNRTRLEVTVTDKLKSTIIKNAKVSLINQEMNEKEKFLSNNPKGIYLFDIVPGRKYRVEIQCEGYKTEIAEVTAAHPEQKTLRLKGQMEKYNKIFVKGRVVLHGEGGGICKIQVFDPTADSVETLYSNVKGEFQCQINTDTTNILVAAGQKMMGIFIAMPEKRKRKSSSIQFIELQLGTLDSVIVKGIFKSSNAMLPGWNSQVIIRNELTNREELLRFNEKGEFAIKLWDSCQYTLYLLLNNNNRKLIKNFEPMKTRFMELVE